MKKASLTQVALIILSCTIVVAVKTGVINLCKRQPFRGRCPAVKGKGPSRSQFVLRYYLRDNECVSYPFGHCADDENEPMLYRYKKDCEKACLNERNNTSSATAEAVEEESASALGNKGIGTTKHHVGTTSTVPSTMTTAASLQRTSFTAKKNKNKPHKLLTECERQRQASASGLIKSDFIPICTADGSFRTLQCRAPGRDCFCVDHNGVKIPNSESSGTTKPKCKQIIKARKLWMDECVSPPDSGPCNSAITRWYYDYKQQQCLEFRYSGCGGSENNHPTKADCEKQCKPAKSDVKCKDGLEPLKDENGRLANCAEIACPVGYLCSIVQSGSACCPNSTSSKATDTHSDATPDICQLPKDRGPCDQYELRFYYNNRLNECKYFFFGGCEGNANNFERVEECERFCRQRGAKANGSSIVVSAPQLITSGPQMRKLSKEFGTKPVEKANERSRLEEVTDNSASGGTKHNMGSSISDVAKTTDITDTTGGANSESNERNSSSSQTTDFSASSTNENKIELSQNIHQNVHKEMKDETTTSSDSSSPDFSPVQPKSTTTALRNTEKFVTSGDQSSKSSQEFSSQSVTVTGQQLSDRQEQVKISSSKMSTIRRHPNTGGEERLSDRSKLSSASPTDSSPSNTITAQLITSSTAEPLVPEATESIDDRCLQKRDRGTCTGQFIRWHWDSERNTCQVFTYSGCDGNGNNFRSREDCFAACHQPTPEVSNMDNVCNHSIHPGDCAGAFQRFAFDSTIGDCRPFTYTGCGGNGNNFGSSLECRNKCAANKPTLSTDICQHPIEVGECSGVFPRFAYDLIANECRQFTYGGCGGNGNNFGSIAECKETCVREQRNVSVQCPVVDISLCVEPCALFVNRRGCRECTCPVAHTTTYNQTKNGLAESSTSSPAMSFTSSADESRILETEQFPRSRAEKKLQLTPHPPKISQINAVTAELGEKCSQPMDAGPCENFIKRWFFDVSTGQCKSFEYGGCAGNRNHFFSKNECEIHCARFFSEIEDPDGDGSANEEEEIDAELLHQQSVADSQVTQKTTPLAVVVHGVTSLQKLQLEADDTCVLPPDAGTCRDYVPRWFYNSQTGKCEQFSYGSCGGNSNNFLDREACEGKCSRGDLIKSQLPERCTYKKDEGYSNGYNVKWYFNLRNLRCEQMVYQGQGGNLNQFETLLECQTFCTPLGGKAPETDEIAKQIAHSLKATSTSLHPSGTAASQDEANHAQVESIAGISAKHISQSAAESHHRRVVSNDEDEKMRQISSKQLTISSQLPLPTAAPFQVPENLNTPRSGAVAVREPSLEPSLVVSAVNESNDKVVEKKIDGVKTLGIARENSDNDVVADLSNVFEDIGHTPSCPNGLKPAQHADGRPMMCLPGRNQCSDNSLCYFNGVDFFCCPNPEDPYDEHVFGGYGGEEVKRGYKNAKKTPTGGNELIVRKLRLKRHAQVFGTRASEINTAARIDSKIQRSLTTASLAANDSDANKQEDNICMLDATTGKCNEAHLRFFYDRRVGTCRLFYYSGCGGNENNFVTEDECRRRCKNEKVHVDDALPGSCPFGEPPFGDNAPVICGKDAQSFECPKGYYCRMGPPNVCCLEKSLPSLEKILVAKKNQKNIRFSPHTGYVPSEAQGKDEDNSPSSLLPTNICPDGSDALLDESTQKPLKCGLGYDGQSFCPVGYYCSIDSERNGRLCCKLGIIGVNIPPPPTAPPFFGLRPSNPGEVIPRGSLPSDYIREEHYETGISNVPQPNENHSPYVPLGITKLTSDVNRLTESSTLEKEATYSSRNLVQPYVTAGSSANPDQYNKETDSSENHTPSDMEFQDNSYGRMMLKSKDQTFQTRGETNEVQIDVGEMKDPFESLEYAQKPTSDRSICLLKPNEGRTCREDESPPRTNLQYFYSSRDKRCKLYFYRGCGGSQNRFDTKRHCELTCASV